MTRFRRSTARCESPTACSPPARISRCRGSCRRTARGIFPWFSEDQPILWWSPDPRMVLVPGGAARSRARSASACARRDYEVRADTAFGAVMRACAEPRAGQDGTWITAADDRGVLRPCTAPGTRIRSRPGSTASSPAGSTASRSAACSSASRCSRARPTPPRSRSRTSCGSSSAGSFGMIDCQMATAHLARSARARSREPTLCESSRELVNYPPTGRSVAARR